jgi:hypothetical protein
VPWHAIRDITWGDGGQVALAHDQHEDLGMP